MNKQKIVISSSCAALLAITFVTIITIGAEISPSLKDWLKNLSGHHWTSKSILSVLIYLVSFIIINKIPFEATTQRTRQCLINLLIGTIIGAIAIIGFFTGHYFGYFNFNL